MQQGESIDLKAELEALRAPAAAEAAAKAELNARADRLRAELAAMPEQMRTAATGPAANDAQTARARIEALEKRDAEARAELAQVEQGLRETPAADALAALAMQAVIYVHENGRVRYTIEPPAPAGAVEQLAAEGKAHTFGRRAPLTAVYVDGEGLLRRKPAMPAQWEGAATIAAGGEAELVLIAPPGAAVWIEGERAGEVDQSGRFAIAAGEPGRYDVMVQLWPYLNADLQFMAE